MKEYIVEFIDPKTNHIMVSRISAEDKTAARDLFYESYPTVEYINRVVVKS